MFKCEGLSRVRCYRNSRSLTIFLFDIHITGCLVLRCRTELWSRVIWSLLYTEIFFREEVQLAELAVAGRCRSQAATCCCFLLRPALACCRRESKSLLPPPPPRAPLPPPPPPRPPLNSCCCFEAASPPPPAELPRRRYLSTSPGSRAEFMWESVKDKYHVVRRSTCYIQKHICLRIPYKYTQVHEFLLLV